MSTGSTRSSCSTPGCYCRARQGIRAGWRSWFVVGQDAGRRRAWICAVRTRTPRAAKLAVTTTQTLPVAALAPGLGVTRPPGGPRAAQVLLPQHRARGKRRSRDQHEGDPAARPYFARPSRLVTDGRQATYATSSRERRLGRLHCGAGRRRPSSQSIWICAPWSADPVPSSRHEGAFQPSFPTLNLYVAGYCWLSYYAQCRQPFREGWDRGPRSPSLPAGVQVPKSPAAPPGSTSAG